MQPKNKAYRLYIFYNFLTNALFQMTFTVSSLYYIQKAGLNPLQLVLVGTTLEFFVFAFEIPTGVVADVYSRRLSIIIGVFMIGCGLLVEGTWPLFITILIAQFLWGVGWTFTSGSLEAWISDEIGEENSRSAFLRGAQVSQLGAFIGVPLGTLLGTIRLNLPLQISGVFFLVFAILLIFIMPETGFKPVPAENRTTWGKMIGVLRAGFGMVRKRPAMANILAIGFFFGLYSEGFDRLWVAFMLDRYHLPFFQPVVWIGILNEISLLVNMGAIEIANRRAAKLSLRSLVIFQALVAGGLVVSLAGFALIDWLPAAVVIFTIFSALREVFAPLYTAWVNHKIDSSVRATVISISSQMDAFGQIAGGPLVGLIARQISIQAGLLTSTGLLSPVLILFGKHLKKDAETQEILAL